MAHFEQAMLPHDMRESIDNPCDLVVTAIASGARAIDTLRNIVLLYEWQEFLVDGLEEMLAPGDKVAPNADVIPKIWKPFLPSLKHNFEVAGALLEIHGRRSCQRMEYLSGLLKFDKLLEVLEKWDVHSGNYWRE